jgi:hypothetical protein
MISIVLFDCVTQLTSVLHHPILNQHVPATACGTAATWHIGPDAESTISYQFGPTNTFVCRGYQMGMPSSVDGVR